MYTSPGGDPAQARPLITPLVGAEICRKNQIDVAFTAHHNTLALGIQRKKRAATQKITPPLGDS
jgi:hypothetical protein